MSTYIAFLRAVNVGGRVVKMDRLRQVFTGMGFDRVRSFIQTGNVFFDTHMDDRDAVRLIIEQGLLEALGFDVTVMLRTIPEVESAVNSDAFDDVEVTADTRLVLTFTSQPLPEDLPLPLTPPKKGFSILKTTPGEAFIVMTVVDGRAGNPNDYIERTFKVRATSRFFGTTARILEAARAPGPNMSE